MKDLLDDMPDDDLRKKLQNYEEEPNADLFQRINADMNKQLSAKERLQFYSEEVPESVWSGVQNRLLLEDFLTWLEWASRVAAAVALLMLLHPLAGDKSDQSIAVSNKNEVITPGKNKSGISKIGSESVQPEIIKRIQLPEQNVQVNKHRRNIVTSIPSLNNLENLRAEIAMQTSSDRLDLDIFSEDQIAENSDDSITFAIQDLDSADVLSAVQKKEKRTGLKKPKGLYALVMPTFGYQQIDPVDDDNLLIESIEKVSAFSFKRLGIRAEAGIERQLSNRVGVTMGVFYFQREQSIEYIFRDSRNFTIERLSKDSLGYQVNLPERSGTFEYEIRNVGFVFSANYNIRDKKIRQKIGIGAEVHKSLKTVSAEVASGNNVYLFSNVYYRISYPISRRVDLMLQPTFNYSFTVDDRINAPFYVKPYGLGLNFGGYFHF